MNLDDLKDQLLDNWERLKNRIAEDPSFNSLKERYETLPAIGQKGLLVGVSLLLLLILIYIPYGYFETAREYENKYNTYKNTIRELLKIGKSDVSNIEATQRGDLEGLKERITTSINSFNLTSEQIQPITLIPKAENSLARPPIEEETFAVRLNKLNLDQLLQIGADLHRQFNNLKMTGMIVTADKEKAGYFNIEFRLSKFYLPEATDNSKKMNQRDSKANRRGKKK
ncbi:MAG: hypothetical protein KDD40_01130 [Bdellovibrionales bacterium]|nr:hypothetical protein [Bdellovibrionales bacterium]